MRYLHKLLVLTLLSCILATASFATFAAAQNQASIAITQSGIPWIVDVMGQGFGDSELVVFTLQDPVGNVVTILGQTTSDSSGNIMTSFSVPVDIDGQYIINATSPSANAAVPYYIEALPTVSPTPIGAPAVTASPENSNILNVTGKGLDSSKPVALNLTSNGTVTYSFTEQITTNATGYFSAIVIIPTSLSGTFTLQASTTTRNATTQITVPNLAGPTGPAGPTGATGATGPAGADSTSSSDNNNATIANVVYAALAISIIAIAIAIYVLIKKR